MSEAGLANPSNSIFLGAASGAGQAAHLALKYANRHGLVAGATGTGKTVTLRVLAEGLSAAGIPVFLADVKGDLNGLALPGDGGGPFARRAAEIGLENYAPAGFPVAFWDVFGEAGHPLRTTVSEMGPVLLARLLDLPEAQEGVLNIAFRVADEDGLLLLDFKDLRALLAFVGDNAQALATRFGTVSKASVGAIQRRLLVLEQQGGDAFFGEPALDLADLMAVDEKGRGRISLLAAGRLLQSPKVYATVLLWLLAELFEELPEAGDLDKPKLVFFFDEAHLLFDGAPRALVDQVEQVVRLIRSKGVGVYFVTQSPLDLPEKVLGQLGNRVQHALRAFTPGDRKVIRAVAETFPESRGLDTQAALTQLAVGEALISTLEGRGTPSATARVLVRPPASRLKPLTPVELQAAVDRSPLFGKYEDAVDRESAYEMLAGRSAPAPAKPAGRAGGGRTRESVGEALMKSAARAVGSAIGRALMRGVLGAMKRRR